MPGSIQVLMPLVDPRKEPILRPYHLNMLSVKSAESENEYA